MDCHVETYRDNGLFGKHRECAIHTASGRTLYVTWPYASEDSARQRARRWLREEYEKNDVGRLFPITGH